METNNTHNIVTVRIGNGEKVHYAVGAGSITFCGLYKRIHKVRATEVNCDRCAQARIMVWANEAGK
jgi:hypothetical protein